MSIRVVVKEPGKRAEVRMIDPGLSALQSLVGGYIEAIHPWRDLRVHAYLNEDGKRLGLAPNFRFGDDVVVGTVVFSKANASGDEVGFEDETEADEIARRVNGTWRASP